MSAVGVIDGCQVLYTPFRFVVIPPPMSANELSLPAPVNELVFSPPPHSNDFLALLSDFQVAVFSLPGSDDAVAKLGSGCVVVPPAPELVGTAR